MKNSVLVFFLFLFVFYFDNGKSEMKQLKEFLGEEIDSFSFYCSLFRFLSLSSASKTSQKSHFSGSFTHLKHFYCNYVHKQHSVNDI